jgi:nucleoside phosphorylase
MKTTNGADAVARTLIGILREKARAKEHRVGILQDLMWKIRQLPFSERAELVREAIQHLETGEVDEMVKLLVRPAIATTPDIVPERTVDIGILTARRFELEAVLTVFGLKRHASHDFLERGRRYWYATVQSGSRRVRCCITTIAEPRNVPAALATSDLIRIMQPSLCLMVGIAAGLKKGKKNPGVSLGDVILPRRVLDYEHVRLEVPKRGAPLRPFFEGLERPAQFACHKDVVGLLETIRMDDEKWRAELRRTAKTLRVPLDLIESWSPTVRDGVMLAGEKLIANGRLNDMRLRLHDQIRGADQEDSGFAQAVEAESDRVYWAVVRGISDYGDGDKAKTDPTQPAAAASAGIVARRLCESFGGGLSRVEARRAQRTRGTRRVHP